MLLLNFLSHILEYLKSSQSQSLFYTLQIYPSSKEADKRCLLNFSNWGYRTHSLYSIKYFQIHRI